MLAELLEISFHKNSLESFGCIRLNDNHETINFATDIGEQQN